jgi:hypothetical protein
MIIEFQAPPDSPRRLGRGKGNQIGRMSEDLLLWQSKMLQPMSRGIFKAAEFVVPETVFPDVPPTYTDSKEHNRQENEAVRFHCLAGAVAEDLK